MANRNVNKNVSTSALSRVERAQINELVVLSEFSANKTGSRTNKSNVWCYFGALHHAAADGKTTVLDDDRLYCVYACCWSQIVTKLPKYVLMVKQLRQQSLNNHLGLYSLTRRTRHAARAIQCTIDADRKTTAN